MAEQHELAKPLADRVLIKVEKEVTKTAGGIILPETVESRDTKIGTVVSVGEGIYTNDGVKIPMSRVSVEGKKKMAEIAKEDINVQIEKNVEKFATLTNQTKCGCGRSETGFCTGLHRIPKKAWADGVRDIPAEKPKRKYTKKATK